MSSLRLASATATLLSAEVLVSEAATTLLPLCCYSTDALPFGSPAGIAQPVAKVGPVV